MLNWLTRAGLRASGILMIAMMLSIALEVVARQVFNFSFLVIDELSGYLLVAISFLGVAHSLRSGSIIRVDVILMSLPAPVRKCVSFIYLLLSMTFTLVITFELGKLVVSSYSYDIVSAAVFAIPQFIPQLVMPLGFGLLFLALVEQAWRLLAGNEDDGDGTEKRE